MPPARWLLPETDPLQVRQLAAALGISGAASRVLCARGLHEAEAARHFIEAPLNELHDPFAMAGMREAVERLARAIRAGEKILIYGDYDVDGTTAVVLLKKAIELAGGAASFFIPHRLKDGYGMRAEVVESAAAGGISLIVSVDTGIRAAEVVRVAANLGIDVIVTDHHLPESELPPALAVLNPNRPGCAYPEKNLCGAGVAFKLAQALLGTLGWPAEKLARVTESFLKIVALGTVADVVPLRGENRIIVKHGLAGLGNVRNQGLRALLDVAGFTGAGVPTAGQVAFRIAPRMNAAGRMDTATAVIELFLTGDAARAREIAVQLDTLNQERQRTEERIINEILAECLRSPVDGHSALVFCGEGWHRGVLGIVASRLVERFHRPAFVLGMEDGLARGSGRSVPGFHLLEALESMPEFFSKFGGHVYAAGVTLSAANVDAFRERFNAYAAERLRPEDLVESTEIDALIELDEIDERAVADVLALAPFGCGNPAPRFAAMNVEVAGASVWKERHLRLAVRHNGRTLTLKAWNFAPRAAELRTGARIDVAFSVEADSYTGWAAVLAAFRHVAVGCAAAT
jgi:single-stranded-DNA-specific exonuclease